MSNFSLVAILHQSVRGVPVIPGGADGSAGGRVEAPEIDWRAVSQRLSRFAMALTGGRDQAEDLSQQAIAILLAKGPQVTDHVAYGRRTITRLWLDQQRSVRRAWKRMVAAASGAVSSFAGRMPASEMHEQVERLRRAIEALPARQRAAITLRLVEGLDYAEVAEAMECDVGAVRSTLHLARTRLRKVLEGTERDL